VAAEALEHAGRAFARNPNFDPTLWMLIAAHAHLGRMDEARRYLGKLQAMSPGITVARIREGQPAKDPGRVAAVLEGLRMAGLPRGSGGFRGSLQVFIGCRRT
jgi:adenylate cyclase